MLRKMLCRLVCCIAILCLAATSVFASGSLPGAEGGGVISFDFNDNDISVQEGSVLLRQVARWDEASGSLELCEDFAACGLSAEELSGKEAAHLLAAFAEEQSLPALRVEIGPDGTGKTELLPLGVWLLTQDEPFPDCLPTVPALISLPSSIDGALCYEVEAHPKVEPIPPEPTEPSTTEPTEPSTTEPDQPELPQTGQLNWPVPLLGVGGCLMILLGLCLRRERKNHES